MIALLALAVAAAAPAWAPGIYTNEEQVYFAGQAHQPVPPWIGIKVAADGSARRIDAFGEPVAGPLPDTPVATADGYAATSDGQAIRLQKARAFKCWASIPRRARKADGREDWWFQAGLMLHDRGGRVVAATDDPVPQRFTLRLRNVVWPTGSNAPSLVLYIHTDDADHAIAYAWADPAAVRIGLNLRQVQASCSLVT